MLAGRFIPHAIPLNLSQDDGDFNPNDNPLGNPSPGRFFPYFREALPHPPVKEEAVWLKEK